MSLNSGTESTMRKYFVFGFLLVCCISGWSSAELVADSIAESIGAFTNLWNSWSQLYEDAKLYMPDDNGNPIPLDPLANYTESLLETITGLNNKVLFYLYTRNTIDDPELLKIGDLKSLRESQIDLKKDTKFVTHGWYCSRKFQSCTLIKDAFLKHDDCNVIVVDWSALSMKPYVFAISRMPVVSQQIANMIDFLVSLGLNRKQITIVGHSLGAHVAGMSSRYAKNKAAYVVALDPAQPLIIFNPLVPGVARGDGDYVEVIHTNGGVLGFPISLGDADFYPNGGSHQNGCAFDPFGTCSHMRAFKYFAESINNDNFVGYKCSSYAAFKADLCDSGTAFMGGAKPNPKATGVYYLDTNTNSPFARGDVYSKVRRFNI